MPINFSNTSIQYFKTTILFSMVERSSSYVFRHIGYVAPYEYGANCISLKFAHYAFKLDIALKINRKVLCFMLVTSKTLQQYPKNDCGH